MKTNNSSVSKVVSADQRNHILNFLNERCEFWDERVREVRRSDHAGYLGVCKGERAECHHIRLNIFWIFNSEIPEPHQKD